MEVKAKARYIRMSPRKIRLVVDVVRGMPVTQALTQLKFMKKHAALPVSKLIESAIANAENNFKLKRDSLFVKTSVADGGPTLHRWTPKAHGRATPIRKRTTHITVVLDELEKKETKVTEKKVDKEKKVEEKKVTAKKPAASKKTNK